VLEDQGDFFGVDPAAAPANLEARPRPCRSAPGPTPNTSAGQVLGAFRCAFVPIHRGSDLRRRAPRVRRVTSTNYTNFTNSSSFVQDLGPKT